MERVPGGPPAEEIIDRIRTRLARLHTWEFKCPPPWRYVVEAIFKHGHTITGYADFSNMNTKTVSAYMQNGLQEYCDIHGLS